MDNVLDQEKLREQLKEFEKEFKEMREIKNITPNPNGDYPLYPNGDDIIGPGKWEHKDHIYIDPNLKIDYGNLKINFDDLNKDLCWKNFKIEYNELKKQFTLTFVSSNPCNDWAVVLSKENLEKLIQVLGNCYAGLCYAGLEDDQ